MSCCRRASPGRPATCCARSAEAARPRTAAARARGLLAAACLPWLVACSLVREPAPAPPHVPAERVLAPGPPSALDAGPGRRLLALAERQLGAPYRFGGATPDGFDCSGLVRWAHGAAGMTVPRTAAGQQLEARPVPLAELQAGDLVFFRIDGGAVDHVGIYAGEGRFLHAPRRGRTVGYDRLDDPWWLGRQAGAGRFWVPAAPARPAPDADRPEPAS